MIPTIILLLIMVLLFGFMVWTIWDAYAEARTQRVERARVMRTVQRGGVRAASEGDRCVPQHDASRPWEVGRVPGAPVNMKAKLAEALMTLIAVAVVARVVWGLLGPLLPYLLILFVLSAIFVGVIRGPHAGG